MTDQDTIDWLSVWVNGVGLGERTIQIPHQFMVQLVGKCRDVLDRVLAERITTQELSDDLADLQSEAACTILGSLSPELWARYDANDQGVRLAALAAISLWILAATDALILNHGDMSLWRYQLAWTQSQALELFDRQPAI
jgi:hypothetical protein